MGPRSPDVSPRLKDFPWHLPGEAKGVLKVTEEIWEKFRDGFFLRAGHHGGVVFERKQAQNIVIYSVLCT